MSTIVLLPCAAEKKSYPTPARDLYQGKRFRKMFCYARSLHPDDIFILSGKHHLLPTDQIIAPYDVNLEHFSQNALKQWAARTLQALHHVANLQNDHFVVLANITYRKYLLPDINSYSVPLKGMDETEQLHYLTEAVK